MSEKHTQHAPFVSIKPVDGKVLITWGLVTLVRPEKNNSFSCAIPSLNIFFSAKDKESIAKKTKYLSRFYFDHLMLHANKNGLKSLVLDLHKLGYKANNNIDTIHKLINNKVVPAKFKMNATKVPVDFDDAVEEVIESDMEFALS